MATKPRVVVLGGGFGGLESAFYLRHRLGHKVDITLVSDRPYFLYKPNTIYIPFGDDPDKFKIPLDRPTRRKDITFVETTAESVDPATRTVVLGDRELRYDYLVVATGADMRPGEIPGLSEHAVTVWTPEDMMRLRRQFETLVERARAGVRQSLVFLIPPNNRCAGPLYEIVLMTDTWLRRRHVRENVTIRWLTIEEGFIQAFGPRLNTVVTEEFAERDIEAIKGFVVSAIEPGLVQSVAGDRITYDLLVSFPPYVAGQRYRELPQDDRGFLIVEPDSRRVKGLADVFAVGDAADFPIKQAFLALLQADAAAEHVSAAIERRHPALDFEPVSMCVMEEFNKATFAQVPLTYTGDPDQPVAVDVADAEHYKVGVSPLWRLGKQVLGLYLPWRFGHGEPFHAGLPWHAMDVGLKAMSKVLAK